MESLSPDQPEFKPAVDVADLLKQPEETTELSSADELVRAKLNPRGELDQDGFGREIYTLNNQSFCFRSREELPTYPTAEHSSTFVLGSEPKFAQYAAETVTNIPLYSDRLDDYLAAKQRFETAQSPDKPVHYSVDRTTQGLAELLHHLQPDNDDFTRLASEVSAGQYGEEALTLIDKVAAVALMDPETGKPRDVVDSNAEALVALSELGDQAAAAVVDRALQALRENDSPRQEFVPLSAAEHERVKHCGLMVIHSTRYEPEIGADGNFGTKTFFDATSTFPRASIHTSLNHKVEGHMEGDWTDAGFVLVAPLSDMIDANGKPSNLSGVDTWWTRNPGETLSWQNAVLFAPGGSLNNSAGLSRKDGGRVNIKTENFERSDVQELLQLSLKSGRAGRDLITLLDEEQLAQLKAQPEGSLEQAVDFIMSDSGYAKSLLDGEDVRQADPNYAGIAGVKLSFLREAVQRAVLNDYLQSAGKEIFGGGMWESSGEAQVAELANALHISRGAHSGTLEAAAESVPEPDRAIDYYGAEAMAQMNPKARRVLFASGVRATKYRTPTVDRLIREKNGKGFDFF